MSEVEKGIIAFSIMAFLSGLLVGVMSGHAYTLNKFESQAIDNGAAQYNQKTKQFEWINQ